ncbi:MAG: hypothetical protein QNJ97_15805 [Myxococcota bacterium]|nr:hypothetical protein [Myxococcota bacterium]
MELVGILGFQAKARGRLNYLHMAKGLLGLLSILTIACREYPQATDAKDLVLSVAVDSPNHLIEWQRDEKTSGVTDAHLRALWLDNEGTQGWAVGEKGEILRYALENGWKKDKKTTSASEADLWGLWLNNGGTQGWAVGEYGTVLRYTSENGWKLDEKSNSATDADLRALWLNDEGTRGWAVGEYGTVLQYTLENGWALDEIASNVSNSHLLALWLNDEGTRGWAVGEYGTVLQYTLENGWALDEIASSLSRNNITTLWFNNEATQGWAAGIDGAILQYTLENGWKYDVVASRVTDSSLWALWFNNEATQGWAVGLDGTVVRYTLENDWKLDKENNRVSSSHLFALWLNEKSTQGWAVGVDGEIIRYTLENGWQRDATASGVSSSNITALWLNDEATQGWAVGIDGAILRYTFEDGWKLDEKASEVPNAYLLALWLNDEATQGWAVGIDGAVVRYTLENGWELDENASIIKDEDLLGLWLNNEATQGWAVGERGAILRYTFENGWRFDEKASSVSYADLTALWFNDGGTQGWAVGESGTILRYTAENGWTVNRKANSFIDADLWALWLNKETTQGWAVGDHGSVLRYTHENGWELDEKASGVSYVDLRALCLNTEGTLGWAVGENGTVIRYMLENGWELDEKASSVSDVDLWALWLNNKATQGWVVSRGVSIKVVEVPIKSAVLFAIKQGQLSQLNGTFGVKFQQRVNNIRGINIVDSAGNTYLNPTYYEVDQYNDSDSVFEFSFTDKIALLSLPEGEYRLRVTANMGRSDSGVNVDFDTPFEIRNQVTPKTQWGIILIGGFLLLNLLSVLLATKFGWARSVILHRVGSQILGLVVGKYLIIDALIFLVRPIRNALLRDYRRNLADSPGLRKWRASAYVPPTIRIIDSEKDRIEFESGSDIGELLWVRTLDTVLSHRNGGVWLVQGPSGLGKTALVENWARVALEKGWSPFLIRLGSELSPASEATSMLNQYGDVPLSSDKSSDMERAGDLLSRGRFLILLDAVNEDSTPNVTREFVRKMARRNVIVVTSQFKPNWDNIDLMPITLEPFGRDQLKKILPENWLEVVLKAEHLTDLSQLPQSSKLLAKYIERNGELPPSPLDIYEDLCTPIASNPKLLNLEEEAWKRFCDNQDQFNPSDALPDEEICLPAVDSGLLTPRQKGDNLSYKFSHERVHRYLVARYLSRQDQKSLMDWNIDVKPGLGRRYWADTLQFWGAIIAERVRLNRSKPSSYIEFLREVAEFEYTMFADRLYPQYERLRDSKRIECDTMLERWAANLLAKIVGNAL